MESNFCRKFILSKFGQIGFSNRIFCILSKIDAKWKFFWYLTFHGTPYFWQNLSGVITQNVLGQPDCKILQSIISIKRIVRDQVDVWFADKHQTFLQVNAIAFGWCGQVCPGYRFEICLQYVCRVQVCNMFVTFVERGEDWIWLAWKFSTSWYVIVFTGHSQPPAKYPK